MEFKYNKRHHRLPLDTRFSISHTRTADGYSEEVEDDNELLSFDEAIESVDALVSDELSLPLASSGSPPDLALNYTLTSARNANESSKDGTYKGLLSHQSSRFSHIFPAILSRSMCTSTQGNSTTEESPLKKKALKSTAGNVSTGPLDVAYTGTTISPHHSNNFKNLFVEDDEFTIFGDQITATTKAKAVELAVPTAPEPTTTVLKPNQDKVSHKGGDWPIDSAKVHHSHIATPKASKNPLQRVQKQPANISLLTDAFRKPDQPLESPPFPPLPIPSQISTPSIASRALPKTLRVVHPASKTNVTLASPATTTSYGPHANSKYTTGTQRPSSPTSEMISDTASVVSATISTSRAGSPPPPSGKIGTAPVRGTTKSQQRKQRKEALKQEAKIIAQVSKSEIQEHAPVVGRKKKQRKERQIEEPSGQLYTPFSNKNTGLEGISATGESQATTMETPEDNHVITTGISSLRVNIMEPYQGSEIVPQSLSSLQRSTPYTSSVSVEGTTLNERSHLTPAYIFAEIRKSLWTSVLDTLQLIKPLSSAASKLDLNQASPTYCKDYSCKCGDIQDDDLSALRAGKPVRKQLHTNGTRLLITPHGDCVRGLSSQEEDVFLVLQAAIAATAENPGAFVAPRHQPGSGAFSLIKGRAVPNGRPSIFPVMLQPQSQDPIGKMQREDALSYINQYVLPRLSFGTSNAILSQGYSASRDSAAASLNSLAPYFYGPDAAAGVGIYSAPDGARALQDIASHSLTGEELGKGVSGAIGSMPLMTVDDAESALATARRETEKLEKGLNSIIRRNRKLLLSGGN